MESVLAAAALFLGMWIYALMRRIGVLENRLVYSNQKIEEELHAHFAMDTRLKALLSHIGEEQRRTMLIVQAQRLREAIHVYAEDVTSGDDDSEKKHLDVASEKEKEFYGLCSILRVPKEQTTPAFWLRQEGEDVALDDILLVDEP